MKRSVVLSGFVAALCLFMGAAYLSLPWIAGWGVRSYLAGLGFKEARITADQIGLTRSVFVDLDLGPESKISARKITIEYTLSRLVDGILDAITVDRPEVPLGIGAQGIDLGVLEKFVAPSDKPVSAPAIRLLGPLTFTAGRLTVATQLGAVDAAVEGVVLLTDGIGTDANIEFALQHPAASVSGRMRGILDATNQVQLTLDIQNASSDAQVAFSEMTGTINIKGQLPAALNGGGSLKFQHVRIDGLELGNVDLVGNVNGRKANAEFLLGGAGTGLSLQLRAETEDVLDPETTLHLSGEAATDGLRGPFALPVDVDMVGAMTFDVSGSRRDLQAMPGRIASGAVRSSAPVTGTLEVSHLGVRAPETGPGNAMSAGLDGTMSVAIDERGWRLKPEAGLNIDLGLPSETGDRHFVISLDGMADVPFLAGGPSAADPLRLGVMFDGSFNSWFPFAGNLGGSIWPSTTDGVVLEDLAVRFDPWRLRLAEMGIVADKVSVRLSGPLHQLDMEVSADTRFSGKLSSGFVIDGGRASIVSRIGYGADGVKIYPENCTEIRATKIEISGASIRPGPIQICPTGKDTPLLHAVMENGALKRFDMAAILKSVEVAMQGIGPHPLSGMLPGLQGTASIDAGRGTWWAKVLTSGGDLRIEGPDIAVADMDGTISLEGLNTVLGAKVDLRSARLVDHRRPLRFTPLSLDGAVQYQPTAASFNGHAGFNGGLNGAPKAAIDARYRMHDRRGSVKVTLPTWTITEQSLQPQTLLPILKGRITHVSGAVGGEAQVNWAENRVSSSARISLDNLAFGTTPAEIAGLSGDIVLDDLLGLKTGSPQTLKVGLIDAGLPLSNGEITLTLPGEGAVHINRAVWPLAGGSFDIVDLNIPADGMPAVVIGNIKDMDATELARSINIDGLEAKGRLSGSVPIRIGDNGPVIDDARIWSLNGGVLKFRSKAALESLRQSGEMAELLAKALSDFRFNDLQISMDGPLSGDITAKAKIKGANPALYDGKRIELNVTLQGALRDLLQSASVINDLPETIRDRVRGPSGKP